MIEKLNAYKGDVTIPIYGTIADAEVYLKKDVDAVIAELKAILRDHCINCPVKEQEDDVVAEKDKETAELKEQVHDYALGLYVMQARAEKEARHHKYKRCLAMAGRCRLRGRLFGACGLYEKELWALKWHKRWLGLTEKFKEAK